MDPESYKAARERFAWSGPTLRPQILEHPSPTASRAWLRKFHLVIQNSTGIRCGINVAVFAGRAPATQPKWRAGSYFSPSAPPGGQSGMLRSRN
jgi:hypothetical protein